MVEDVGWFKWNGTALFLGRLPERTYHPIVLAKAEIQPFRDHLNLNNWIPAFADTVLQINLKSQEGQRGRNTGLFVHGTYLRVFSTSIFKSSVCVLK